MTETPKFDSHELARNLIKRGMSCDQIESLREKSRVHELYASSPHLRALYSVTALERYEKGLASEGEARDWNIGEIEQRKKRIPELERSLEGKELEIRKKKDSLKTMATGRRPRRKISVMSDAIKALEEEHAGISAALGKARNSVPDWDNQIAETEQSYRESEERMALQIGGHRNRLDVLYRALRTGLGNRAIDTVLEEFEDSFDRIEPSINNLVYSLLMEELAGYERLKAGPKPRKKRKKKKSIKPEKGRSYLKTGTVAALILSLAGLSGKAAYDYFSQKPEEKPDTSQGYPTQPKPLTGLPGPGESFLKPVEKPPKPAERPRTAMFREIPIYLKVSRINNRQSERVPGMVMAAGVKKEYRKPLEALYTQLFVDFDDAYGRFDIEENDLLDPEVGVIKRFQYDNVPELGDSVGFTVYGIRRDNGKKEVFFRGELDARK